MDGTYHSEWRLRLARQVVDIYREDAGIRAVGVTGSVARQRADRHSDVELLVVWEDAPSEMQREAVARRAGGREIRLYPHGGLGTDEWSEDYLVQGVKLDVTHLTGQGLDTRPARERFDQIRPVWESAPDS
jgi:predicted nucleotidyltransferase